jgi:hypothetical protein
VIFTPCGGQPASCVIEVPSSVRLDPPPHPSWPRRRRTDEPPVKNNNSAPVRDGLRRMLQNNNDLLKRQHAELETELGPRLRLEFRHELYGELLEPDVDPEECRRKLAALGAALMYNQVALTLFDRMGTPGRRSSDEWYDGLLTECLNDAGRVKRDVRRFFLERAMGRRKIELGSAENKLREALKRRFPNTAPRA